MTESTFTDETGVVRLRGTLSGSGGPGLSVRGPFVITSADVTANDAPIPIYTPGVGDLLLDVWVQLVTLFNVNNAKADVGQFLGGTTTGWFKSSTFGQGLEVDQFGHADAPPNTHDQLLGNLGGGNIALSVASVSASKRNAPAIFTGTAPVQVVVSVSGAAGGGALGSSAGELHVFLLVATPTT